MAQEGLAPFALKGAAHPVIPSCSGKGMPGSPNTPLQESSLSFVVSIFPVVVKIRNPRGDYCRELSRSVRFPERSIRPASRLVRAREQSCSSFP